MRASAGASTCQLQSDPRAVWARVAMTRGTLAKVALALGEHGIDVLAVKGVVTSTWLYADVAERPLRDLDVGSAHGTSQRPSALRATRGGASTGACGPTATWCCR